MPNLAHISDYARQWPDKAALRMTDDGSQMSYRDLEMLSDALAGQLAATGLKVGDHVAILMENRPEFLVATWAFSRAGLYWTPINWHLTAEEIAYIVKDCGARALISSSIRQTVLDQVGVACPGVVIWLCDAQGPSGFAPRGMAPPLPVPYESIEGSSMVYSSGTSGRPKGIKRLLTGAAFGLLGAGDQMVRGLYGWDAETRFLCPAPLYHAAPLNFALATHRSGGTVLLMRGFDPVELLAAIERERVNRVWLVPTMMIRMLKLPEAERRAFDLSSVTHVVHSAAPCPRQVKQAMMDWWGPVLHEFYAATEGNGMTAITPQEWLAHPGSVGRSADVRIVGEDGELMAAGEVGTIHFANSWRRFEYHNDPAKTAEAHDANGWSTIGDMGYLDAEGYLFLTDRKTHMIIAGGVNIYPQEAENVLALHPAVEDVAVIGVPHPDYGEEVKAVVQLVSGMPPSDDLALDLMAYCSAHLARYKCPRSVDFVDRLPRMPTGKLLKRELRTRYWGESAASI